MAYGFTYTLPTITGSHTDFRVVLKTADFPSGAVDGGANSIDNGGGNLRAYTSDAKTTQLPLDVVTFVTGGTPEVEVWVKVPTAATSNTIYFEADDTETAQPAVTATYGRNAVWSDTIFHCHCNDTSGSLLDSSGNEDLAVAGSLTYGATGKIGDAVTGAGSGGLTKTSRTYDFTGGYRFSFWGSLDATQPSYACLIRQNNLDGYDWSIIKDGGSDHVNFETSGSNQIFNIWASDVAGQGLSKYDFVYDGSTGIEIFRDGASIGTGTSTAITGFTGRIKIFHEFTTYLDIDQIDELSFEETDRSANWIATEYANQNASTAWGTVGTWAASGGGGTTITGSGALSSQAAEVSGSGSVSGTVTGTGALTSQAAEIAGTGEREITGSGALTSQAADIDGTGTVGETTTGTGALTSQSASMAGVGTREVTGTGSLQSQAAVINSVGEREITGTGALESQSAAIAGSGVRGLSGSGALTAQAATMVGSGFAGEIYGDVYNCAEYFGVGQTVTILLTDPITDQVIALDSNICNESVNNPGMYIWDTTKLATQPTEYKEYIYSMTDGTNTRGGKILIGNLTTAQLDAIWNHARPERIVQRLDIHETKKNTYTDNGTEITNVDFTLTRTDNGDGTFTIEES
jgi:hypothetical protein